jgi:hypothetical protein
MSLDGNWRHLEGHHAFRRKDGLYLVVSLDFFEFFVKDLEEGMIKQYAPVFSPDC